jgi:hypothetical protein
MKIEIGDYVFWIDHLEYDGSFLVDENGIANVGSDPGAYLIKYDTRNSALIKELFSLDK